MIENLHRDGGHATKRRDPFDLDQLERSSSVEVMHHDDLCARDRARRHDRQTPGRVKERDTQEVRTLECLVGGVAFVGIEAQHRQLTAKEEIHDVGDAVAVRTKSTLWMSCRSRGVKHRGVIIWRELDVGRRRFVIHVP